MAPPLAREILQRLLAHPSLHNLTWTQVQRFISMTRKIWALVTVNQTGSDLTLPPILPSPACSFLAAVMGTDYQNIQLCWLAFGDLVAQIPLDESSEDDLFRIHGREHGAGAETVNPPTKTCPRPECHGASLREPRSVESRLYTLRRGVLPVFSISTYCRSCLTRYYHNYSVQNAQDQAAVRVYYEGVPDLIHVTQQTFIERALCIFFEVQMAYSHSSAANIAEIYNMALGRPATSVPNTSRLDQDLHNDDVLDAFFLQALLRDCDTNSLSLSLPHHGLQRVRFEAALDARNYAMAGTGQEMWAHACAKCMKIWTGESDGKLYYMSGGVCDGVTLGHPCCSVHECKVRLRSTQDRFCPQHSDQRLLCCVRSCNSPAEQGHLTCTTLSHREWEDNRDERSTSLFQLRRRLARAGISATAPAGSRQEDVEYPEPPSDHERSESSVPSSMRSNVKGRMSRRWTHNEQLFVRCCGVILSRATMYASEGVSGVKDFLKCTFPFPGSLPSYIFFDNNCNLLKHLIATNDHYFDLTGLPVDVFHAHNKHHETDIFCNTHCNPAMFSELINKDGKWALNSSAAEQANAWFGGFQSIVREMPEPRYNFYLDEMIAIRNRFTVNLLHCQGHHPHFQSENLR